ncbi:MAG TPA: tripartite tricarboxylate transporter substrate-binding protein, partial [Xanthobacteraceae bacterium]|nr:tripartite tricarboxylate transporter substrate-binding protein [Xanthobacteraceae bacterium]
AKSKPGQVLHATVIGSLPHLASELFAQRAGIKWTQVPYQGSPQTVTDVNILAGLHGRGPDRGRQAEAAGDRKP